MSEKGPRVRPAHRDDVAVLADIMASEPLWASRYLVTREAAATRFQTALAKGATIEVAEMGQATAGFIWYDALGAFGRSGYVVLVGVRHEWQGAGVGRALMNRAESRVFAEAADVFLLVADFNREARAFYQALGYEQVGAIPDYVVAGVTECIYRKRRPASGAPAAEE